MLKTVVSLIFLALAAVPTSIKAATILSLDLSITNQITISAGTGAASATVVGTDFTGVYLDQFYSGSGSPLSYGLIGGNLTTANNPTDNSPLLYRASTADTGLNIWSFSTDTFVSFTTGQQAFTGSATWALSSASYTDMLAGSTSGSIFFAADSADDVAGATAIGEWNVISPLAPVPLPASAWLLGAALLASGLYGRRGKAVPAQYAA